MSGGGGGRVVVMGNGIEIMGGEGDGRKWVVWVEMVRVPKNEL